MFLLRIMKIKVLSAKDAPDLESRKWDPPPELLQAMKTLRVGQVIEINDKEVRYDTLYSRIRDRFHNPEKGWRVHKKRGMVYIRKVTPE